MYRRLAIGLSVCLLMACSEQGIKQVVNVQVVTASSSPSASPSSSPSASSSPVTASPSPPAQVTPSPVIQNPMASSSPQVSQCRYIPRTDGSLEVPVNGQPRTLLRGEYELLENGIKVKVTKPGQTDTGRVYSFICNTTTSTKICDKFPINNGELLVPYNGKDRYLKSGEYEVIADGKNSVRVTGTAQPDFGKVYTPPTCS